MAARRRGAYARVFPVSSLQQRLAVFVFVSHLTPSHSPPRGFTSFEVRAYYSTSSIENNQPTNQVRTVCDGDIRSSVDVCAFALVGDPRSREGVVWLVVRLCFAFPAFKVNSRDVKEILYS